MDSDARAALSAAFQDLAQGDTSRAERALAGLERDVALDAATNLRLTTPRELVALWIELPDELRRELARALASFERVDDSAANLYAAGNPRQANELKQIMLAKAPALHSLFGAALASDAGAFAPEPVPARAWIRYAQVALFFASVLFLALKSCDS